MIPSSGTGSRYPRGGVSALGAPPRVVMERERAAPDTDGATEQTVKIMARYIREGAADPEVGRCADYAFRKFGMGLESAAMKCWAVFWWVKHCVKFRLDEATMWRVGLKDEQDLLTAPSVLVRERNPAEDCDGFTMLAASMLTVLGVPVVIATVAVDPNDRRRWSHVFPCAVIDSRVLPLDASHGPGPGWMVPANEINRWQAWGLDGRPSDVRPFAGLHGYRRVARGVGDDSTSTVSFPWYTGGPLDPNAGAAVPIAPASTAWSPQFWQGLINQGLQITKAVVTPPAYTQTVRDPITGQLVSTVVRNTATSAGAFNVGAGALSSNGLLIGGAVLAGVFLLASTMRRQ